MYLANEECGRAFFIADLGCIFGGKVGSEFRVLLPGKGPHEPDFIDNLTTEQCLMIYTDIIEFNVVGDKRPF